MALTGSGNDPNAQTQSQQTSLATRAQFNQQRQRRYGAKNGMTAAQQQQPAQQQAAPSSPVTATGQIAAPSATASPMPPPPTPAPPAPPTFKGPGAGQQALEYAINNPALSPAVVNQMKGQLQDQAAQMFQGNQASIAQNAASRGLTGGGWQGQQEAQNFTGLTEGLLSGYRDIDINAADQNRKNLLAALGVDAQNFGTRANILGTMMGRANSMDNTGLGYAQLNAQQQQALWRALMGIQ